jgi:hypothetical protein
MLNSSLAALRCLQITQEQSQTVQPVSWLHSCCRTCCGLVLPEKAGSPLPAAAAADCSVRSSYTPVEAAGGHEARAACCYGVGSCISKAPNRALLLLLLLFTLLLLLAAIQLEFLLLRLLA